MRSREGLHSILCEALGSNHVYYQPPENVKLTYPCIIYSRDTYDNDKANNGVYNTRKKYSITVITRSYKDDLPDRLNLLPYMNHERRFVTDNLYHDVFNAYI